jgi:integrase/recombinase XerC
VTSAATVDEYLAELAEQRRQSPHTISNYRRDLTRLLALAGDVRPGELQVQQIRRFIAQLHAQGLSGRSLARMLSAWRGYFGWLGQHSALTANPCDGVRPPKSPRRLPNALSVDEAAALLAARWRRRSRARSARHGDVRVVLFLGTAPCRTRRPRLRCAGSAAGGR